MTKGHTAKHAGHTAQQTRAGDESDQRHSRRRFVYWAVVLLVMLLAIPFVCIRVVLPPVDRLRKPGSLKERAEWIAVVCEAGGLAPLPPSATSVRLARSGWSGSRQYYLRFSASPLEIQRFLAKSPALIDACEDVFAPGSKLVESRDLLNPDPQAIYIGRYTYIVKVAPAWFDVEAIVRGHARGYYQGPTGAHELNFVLVDDERHAVYVYVAWGL